MALEYRTYLEAREKFRWRERWGLFDGNMEKFNIAHECIDRHPDPALAIRIKGEDGNSETHSFGELKKLTSQFANLLETMGVLPGDRVALLLFPSLEFYTSMFGTFRRGSVVVPCSPLFGPEAVAFRLEKSRARVLVTSRGYADMVPVDLVRELGLEILLAEDLLDRLRRMTDYYQWRTAADSLCMIQFSSGTTGAPKSVLYRHGAITVASVVMKFGAGLSLSDSYFCPSSPAWGHGIWYGTISPLIFGRAIGTFSGKFDPEKCLEALQEWEVTNMAAISSHYRLIMETGKAGRYPVRIKKISYTGEPMAGTLMQDLRSAWGLLPHCQYGTTEVGPITLDYAGFEDWVVRPGSLGKPMIGGLQVAVVDDAGRVLPQDKIGQIALWRDGSWLKIGDSGYVDKDGYFWYVSRADDVIISSGYTIGPIEVEEALRKHDAVAECAVVGSPDTERGDVVKAFIVLKEGFAADDELSGRIKEFVKTRLSKHEYPREIEFVSELPKTPDGKLKRKDLREQERRKRARQLP
ncbi:MAG: AMP-binding protein [Thermodesulfobacteriota bacterium]